LTNSSETYNELLFSRYIINTNVCKIRMLNPFKQFSHDKILITLAKRLKIKQAHSVLERAIVNQDFRNKIIKNIQKRKKFKKFKVTKNSKVKKTLEK
jgi:hypothetical protein